jgi:fatty-acyl-CoA synthase
MASDPYSQHLGKRPANFQPLSPLPFLERAAAVYPERIAIIHGAQRVTYREFYARARRLASALAAHGIGPGDTVSAMLANTPPMLDAHYGVPMTGGVLHSINTRLDAGIVAFQLDHAAAKVVICDREFAPVMREALAQAKARPLVIDYDDKQFPQAGEPLSGTDYEAFIAGGDAAFGESFLFDFIPVLGLAANLFMPIEHDGHGGRMIDDLRLAVDLNVVRAVKFVAVDQQ